MATKSGHDIKVLYVAFNHIPSPTGEACWITEEVKELARHVDLDIMSLKSDDLAHIERYHGARLLRVPVGKGSFLSKVKAFQRALNRQIDSEDYSLCHFTSIWEGMVLASRKQSLGFKLVYEIHSMPSVDFGFIHPEEVSAVEQSYPFQQQEERCLAHADAVIVGSRQLGDHLMQRGVPDHLIQRIHPCVDLDPFENMEDIPLHSGTILYLGSLAPWQGISTLLNAVAELPHGLPVRLLLVSPQSTAAWTQKLQGRSQMLGLSRKVEFIRPVPLEQLASVVRRANVCVAPLADHEHNRVAASLPHKLLVYMACRQPVVASRQAVVTEFLEDGAHGLLYHPGDASGLARAIQKLLMDRELATRLGNQARLQLEDKLQLTTSLSHLLGVYRTLIGEPLAEIQSIEDPDTAPRMVKSPPSEADQDPETRPIPRQAITGKIITPQKDPQSSVTEDTAPHAKNGDSDTSPETASDQLDPEDFVFQSVEDDTTPATATTSADDWQVMDLAQVELPEPSPAPSDGDPKDRWLLGGPPIPVERAGDDFITQKSMRHRGRGDEATPVQVSDSDVVEMVGTEDIEALEETPAPAPPPKKTKKNS